MELMEITQLDDNIECLSNRSEQASYDNHSFVEETQMSPRAYLCL